MASSYQSMKVRQILIAQWQKMLIQLNTLPGNIEKKFVYFSEVCVVFSHARIAFSKKFEVKHTIYFGWPNGKKITEMLMLTNIEDHADMHCFEQLL